MTETVKQVSFQVSGEFITDFIRKLYYADDLSYEECKDKLIKALVLSNESEEDKEKLFRQIIYGDKKFIGINEFNLVDDPDFDIYNYSRFPKPSFNRDEILIGFLTTDGIFVKCQYGGHFEAIEWIGEKVKDSLVFWASSSVGPTSGVNKDNWDDTITDQQAKWINNHKEFLNENQLDDIERLICMDIWINKRRNEMIENERS